MKLHGRTALIFIFATMTLFAIFSYIALLQVYFHDFYLSKSISNYTRLKKLESVRGLITDCENKPIAMTKSTFKLSFITPLKIKSKDQKIIEYLEEFYGLVLQETISQKKPGEKIIIKENLTLEEISFFLENFQDYPFLKIDESLDRIYPEKELFAHIIGYINKDKNGLYGIEKIYNTILVGQDGIEKNTINSRGIVLTHNILSSPEEGKKIETTLNTAIQKAIAKVFPENELGAALVMEAETGAIRALFSSPSFDPHLFQTNISTDTWNSLQINKSLINRTYQAVYPPGSIYKLLISLILLEEKYITENSSWYCGGSINLRGRKFHCWKKNGHGYVTIKEAISHSCNIPYYQEAITNLNIDTIYKYAENFGFGKKSGTFSDEANGLIPNKIWKKKLFNESWFLGETLSVAIGQGATTATPLQIAQFMMGIMYGYIIPPYIIKEQKQEKRILPYKKENLQIIQENMKKGTLKGTSKSLRTLTDWELYGKTATSQVKKIKHEETEGETVKKYRHHGLFTCWAKYKDHTPLILVFIVENVETSRYTIEIVKNFLLEIGKYYDSLPPPYPVSNFEHKLPNKESALNIS
jgi:penicillin-binding protein 2